MSERLDTDARNAPPEVAIERATDDRVGSLELASRRLTDDVAALRTELAGLRGIVQRIAKNVGASGDILDDLGVLPRRSPWDMRDEESMKKR
jgi:hypothetical protein